MSRQAMPAERDRGQWGLGIPELILAATLGMTALAIAGYLFVSQVRGYADIKNQARLQANLKLAMQKMIHQIANAGACLPDRLDHFSPKPDRLTFAYTDLRGRYCKEGTKVIMSFYTRKGEAGDALMQNIRCGKGPSTTRTLATAPTGALKLGFRYLDEEDVSTTTLTCIKSVQVSLGLQTPKLGALPLISRQQTIRVRFSNL